MHQEATVGPGRDGTSHPPGTARLTHDEEAEKTIVLSPTPADDYNDPLTWGNFRKAWNLGLLAAMTMTMFASLSIQMVFWPQMVDELDVTLRSLNNGLAAQLVGLALGCVIFIPFAEKYGRRPVYIISIAVVAAATWWSAFMKTSAEIFLTNTLVGLAGAVNEAAVQMSIHDIFYLHQRGSANGIYLMAVTAGSFLSPMAAGAQAESSGWRSSYLTLAGWMTGLLLLFVFTFEETKMKARTRPTSNWSGTVDDAGMRECLGAHTGSSRISSQESMHNPDVIRRGPPPFPRYLRLQLVTRTDESLWRTFLYPARVAWFPHVVFTYLEFASGVCWLTVMASMTSIVFSKPPYNFGPAQIGYMATGQLVGSIFGSLFGGILVDKSIIYFARRNRGIMEPEMRLWLLPIPALAMSAGLVVFGLTADRGMHFIFPSIGQALFAYGFSSIASMTFTIVIDSYPNLVAQSFVVIAFFRNAISIAGPFSIAPSMETMSVSAMFIIAGAISLAIHLIAIPLVIWGKEARVRIAPRYYRLSEMMTPPRHFARAQRE